MSPKTNEGRQALARCQGFLAIGDDGPVGAVETPLFPPDRDEPDYLVLRVGSVLRRRRPVVSVALVDDVDPRRGLLYLRGRREEVARLPEQLPLAI
jgi:hypothetical protein